MEIAEVIAKSARSLFFIGRNAKAFSKGAKYIFPPKRTMTTMPTTESRGALIVFEGCDHSGKTTQCKKLVETLNAESINTAMFRFPDRTTGIGDMINEYLGKGKELDDHVVHLLFSANRWEMKSRMLRMLNEGTTLIVDRYAYSGVAFTAAKQGFDIGWCKQPDVGLPKPDAVLFLNLSTEEAAKRATFGGERYEQTDFQAKVAENFEKLKEPYWMTVDANKSIEELHTELLLTVKDIIRNVGQKPVGKLWTTTSSKEC